MLASLWQNVCVVTHANAWFVQGVGPPSYRDLPGFEFSKDLKVTAGWEGDTVGLDLADLFEAMRASGATSARLLGLSSTTNPEIINMAAFAGSPNSAVVFATPSSEVLVQSNPTVTEPMGADRRIWYEHLAVFAYTDKWPELEPDASAQARLASSLRSLSDFASKHSGGTWPSSFRAADEALFSTTFSDEVERAFPLGGDLVRKQLLAGASAGWPFGGMGSWNDQVFEDEGVREECDRLNGTLFLERSCGRLGPDD